MSLRKYTYKKQKNDIKMHQSETCKPARIENHNPSVSCWRNITNLQIPQCQHTSLSKNCHQFVHSDDSPKKGYVRFRGYVVLCWFICNTEIEKSQFGIALIMKCPQISNKKKIRHPGHHATPVTLGTKIFTFRLNGLALSICRYNFLHFVSFHRNNTFQHRFSRPHPLVVKHRGMGQSHRRIGEPLLLVSSSPRPQGCSTCSEVWFSGELLDL